MQEQALIFTMRQKFRIRIDLMYSLFPRLIVVILAVILTACSSGTIVKTYEGEKLQAQSLAVLTAPEYISLVSVNGKRVPKYLLSSINTNYGLKPGINVVVFEYESVWAKAAVGSEGARSELVSSGRKEVVIDAIAGENYNFDFAKASNVRDAKVLAENFSAQVVNASGAVIAQSTEPGIYKTATKPASVVATPVVTELAAENSVGVTAAPVPQPVAADQASQALPTIEGLKVLWKNASAEEKKSFLKWAFQ